MKPFGGAREVLFFGNGNEGSQLDEVDQHGVSRVEPPILLSSLAVVPAGFPRQAGLRRPLPQRDLFS
ncbi:MAG TPA: hypothetical protein VLJ86_28075 [Ramlibacter sp.]|nr:hypothetical protein [Ramlibacter sp.]